MGERAREASDFLKALAHESRLMILCDLIQGERSVGELEALLSLRQSTVSQQLARLRLEGLVAARRDGKTIYYSIVSDKVRSIIGALYESFLRRGAGSAPIAPAHSAADARRLPLDRGYRPADDIEPRAGTDRLARQDPPIGPRPRPVRKQAQKMPGIVVQPFAARQAPRDDRHEGFERPECVGDRRRFARKGCGSTSMSNSGF